MGNYSSNSAFTLQTLEETKNDKYVPSSTLIINSEGWSHEVPYTNNEQSFVSNL